MLEELIKKAFVCDLSACKGACCVAGASGAPLEANEADALKKDFNKIINHLCLVYYNNIIPLQLIVLNDLLILNIFLSTPFIRELLTEA